jgi:uncharacterized Zn-binding protein involved in type VI secretion
MRNRPKNLENEGSTLMGKPAAKQGDKIIATDTHIILMPTPGGPVPTPTPMPFVGTLMSGLSTDVFIEGKPAATVDSVAINQPVHIPAGGPFQKPPTNQGKILMGSTGVFINGKPAARQGDQAITCNDPADAPIGQVVAVGTVFIGETGAGAPARPLQTTAEPKLIKAKIGQRGKIINTKWEKTNTTIGNQIKLTAEFQGFEDGTPAKFIIWEREGSQDTYITEAGTTIQGNKAEILWKHWFRENQVSLKKDTEEKEDPEYFFVVDVEGEEQKPEALKFTYPLDIYLEDENGKPIEDVDYTITLSDGSQRKGKFKQGHAKVEDAPGGKFEIEIEEYE